MVPFVKEKRTHMYLDEGWFGSLAESVSAEACCALREADHRVNYVEIHGSCFNTDTFSPHARKRTRNMVFFQTSLPHMLTDFGTCPDASFWDNEQGTRHVNRSSCATVSLREQSTTPLKVRTRRSPL